MLCVMKMIFLWLNGQIILELDAIPNDSAPGIRHLAADIFIMQLKYLLVMRIIICDNLKALRTISILIITTPARFIKQWNR